MVVHPHPLSLLRQIFMLLFDFEQDNSIEVVILLQISYQTCFKLYHFYSYTGFHFPSSALTFSAQLVALPVSN